MFISLLALVSSLGVNGSARAETRPQGFDLSLYGGYWEGSRNLDSSSYFGLSAGYHISRVFTLEVSQAWIPTQAILASDLTSADPRREDFGLQQGSVNFMINLSPFNFVPYLSGGAGWLITPEESSWVADIGLGAKYYLTHDFALRAHLAMWTSDLVIRDEPYDHFTVTFGITYSIAGNRDIDNDKVINPDDKCPTKPEDLDGFEDADGCADLDNDKDEVPDTEDKCPLEPEDQDGDQDEDGCPDLDDDGDGIPNDEDKCPKVAEDKDGFQDEDGCVDEDNDKDGFKDAEDKCPDEAESLNGFQDKDGCPEFDNDKDGIFDSVDKCKSKPENMNGLEDTDGCPDTINAELSALLGLQPQLQFKSKRAALKRSRKGKERLDQLADALKLQALNVKITATAHKGGDLASLSKERAEAIVTALRERGVPMSQMLAVGSADAELPSGLEATKKQSKRGWVSITPWVKAVKRVSKSMTAEPTKKTVKVKVSKEPKPAEKTVKVKVSKEPKPAEKTVKVKVSKEPKPAEKTVKVKVSKEPKPAEKTVKVKVSKEPKPAEKTVRVKVSKEPKPAEKTVKVKVSKEPKPAEKTVKVKVSKEPKPAEKTVKVKVSKEPK